MNTQSGYGVHTTIYGKLSNDDLYSMYRDESWFQMKESERQQLLQETVNRAAAQKGELGACEVRFSDLDSSVFGQQSGNVIEVNRSIFAQDRMTHEYNGHMIEEAVSDSNLRALETVLHEDIHAWQNQCIDGTIVCADSQLLDQYRANNFTVSMVPDGKGGVQAGSQYLTGADSQLGYYLYYFQSTERDAHCWSELQTMQIVKDLQQKYGSEKSFLEYQKGVLTNGYSATLQEGILKFGNTDFVSEINQVLMNQYYGTKYAVDSKIESVVHKEMAESYKEQLKQLQGRETVNKLWEQLKNDPSVSYEEAIRQTAQMSERYLSAMKEQEGIPHFDGQEQLVQTKQTPQTSVTESVSGPLGGSEGGTGNGVE